MLTAECARFNVPVNGLVSVAMRYTADISREIYKDEQMAVK